MFIAQLIKKLSGLFSLSFITTATVTTTFFHLSLAHFSRAFMVGYHWKIVRTILFRSVGAEIFYRLLYTHWIAPPTASWHRRKFIVIC